MDVFANRLKKCRESIKKTNSQYTQSYVAEKIGVARTTYTAYENGTKTPPPETLSIIADFFGVSVDYLLGRTDNQNTVDDYEIQTIAAHKEGDEWTEEELKTIEDFKAFVRSQRKNKG
ncbi:helix-turn-helix transcriptional regulator [Metasolibacillus sp.]|uniref:helix-turn-helix domain-containing protein n=1 Tax=Metasolibacillus sp. TaxID=2703680 RepID=UPI0025DCF9C3|nr:helix-turn-helix transcriptional regulator [Metasolibacillus sp.]MCT6925272.1 helix-turn-helix transcriptional regulator [Metasolibacillus sp.]MCT6941498.1 helix-turn-helix transcriptional regulator [Metasolibacillus sp.]